MSIDEVMKIAAVFGPDSLRAAIEQHAAEAVARERDRTVSEAPYRFLNESDTVLLREIVAEVQTAEHLRAEKETT